MWEEAHRTFLGADMSLKANLQCLISIGTGVPPLSSFGTSVVGVVKSLSDMITDTESTAQAFHSEHRDLDQYSQYFRFNVENGLGGIGLEETSKVNTIKSATDVYLNTETVRGKMGLFKSAAEKQRRKPTSK